jgi:hypothetical protein
MTPQIRKRRRASRASQHVSVLAQRLLGVLVKGRLGSNPSNRPVGASVGGCISLLGVRLNAHRGSAHIPPLSTISKCLRGALLSHLKHRKFFSQRAGRLGSCFPSASPKAGCTGPSLLRECCQAHTLYYPWSEHKCDLPRRKYDGRDEIGLAGQLAETAGRKPRSGNLAIFLQLPLSGKKAHLGTRQM